MNDLTDLSLLILADLGGRPKRLKKRIETLAEGQQGHCHKYPPKPLRALEERGWVHIRNSANTEGCYIVEITDEGLKKHTELINKLRA